MNAIIMASQHIFGALVIILLLLILGVVILSFADKIFTVYYERGQQHQWHTDNERFNSNAYWFSEDEPTMNLLKNFARGTDVRAARDEWRADRKKQNTGVCFEADAQRETHKQDSFVGRSLEE